MKAFVIAATTLTLSGLAVTGPARAQDPAPQAAPAAEAGSAQGTKLGAELGAVIEAGKDAAATAGTKAEAAGEAAAEAAGDIAQSTAEKAARAAAEAEAAAKEAGAATAAAVDAELDRKANIATPATSDPEAATPAQDVAAEAEAAAKPEVVAPDVRPPAISEAEPGVLASWITSRRIWTTNEPSSTPWNDSALDTALAARPATWQDIAKVDDIVLDDQGQLVGYIADIGGFLGIGAKKVLLGTEAIHLIQIGSERFYATNFTKAELEALPDFNPATVLK